MLNVRLSLSESPFTKTNIGAPDTTRHHAINVVGMALTVLAIGPNETTQPSVTSEEGKEASQQRGIKSSAKHGWTRPNSM